MFCGECGAKLSEDLEKCPVCGTYVSEHYVPQVTDVAEDSQPGVQVEKASEYTVSVERQSGPEITAYSENESFSDQYAVEEKEQKAFPEKNDKNGKWMYAAGVCMVLAMVGVIGFSIWNDNYNASDVADSADQYEELYELEEQIPELRAVLDLPYDRIDPSKIPEGNTSSIMMIGNYLYVVTDGQGIHVFDQDMMEVANILSNYEIDTLSSDGQYIFFESCGVMYQADPDGTNVIDIVTLDNEMYMNSIVPMKDEIYFSYYGNGDSYLAKFARNEKEWHVIDDRPDMFLQRWGGKVFASYTKGREDEVQECYFYNVETGESVDWSEVEAERQKKDLYYIEDENSCTLVDEESNVLHVFEDVESIYADAMGDYVYCELFKTNENIDYVSYCLYKITTNEVIIIGEKRIGD